MINVTCNLCGRDEYRVRFPATAEADALRVDAFRCTHAGYGLSLIHISEPTRPY